MRAQIMYQLEKLYRLGARIEDFEIYCKDEFVIVPKGYKLKPKCPCCGREL